MIFAPVILSAAKNLNEARKILSAAKNDRATILPLMFIRTGRTLSLDQRDGVAGDAFLAASETEAIGGGGFDADLIG